MQAVVPDLGYPLVLVSKHDELYSLRTLRYVFDHFFNQVVTQVEKQGRKGMREALSSLIPEQDTQAPLPSWL